MALNLNGTSQYLSGGPTFTTLPTNWSIAAWVKLNNFTSTQLIAGVTNGGGWGMSIPNAGTLRLTLYGVNDYSSSALSLSANTWIHVLIVKTGTTVAFYVDGVARGTATLGTYVSSGAQGIYLGARNSGGSAANLLGGQLAEVAIWDADVSASLSTLRSGAAAGAPASSVGTPVHYWPLDSSANASAGGFNLTANASPTFTDHATAGLTISGGADTTPPTITSASSFSVAENTTAVATLTANETVTWAKTGGADQALFTLNSSTGALAFTSGRDFENPTDADANNVYVVQVTATDLAANASSPQTISVTVTNVNPETVPGTPGGMVSISNPSATATVVVGSAVDAATYEARIDDGLGGAFGAWTAFGTTTTTWTGIVLGRTYAIEWRGVNGLGSGAAASGTFRVEQGAPSSSGGTFIAALLAVLNT